MKHLLLGTIILLTSCQSSPPLEEGTWTGALTPMNHPEMANPVSYDVSYSGDNLNIQIIGPDSSKIKTRNPHIERDTLYFDFDEPEEQVTLNCALRKVNKNEFSGRCIDEAGKWAKFTMVSPS